MRLYHLYGGNNEKPYHASFDPFGGNSIITTSAEGIVKTTLHPDKDGEFNTIQEYINADSFAEATSFGFKGTLFYTKNDGFPCHQIQPAGHELYCSRDKDQANIKIVIRKEN